MTNPKRISSVLSSDERRMFQRKSDLKATITILINWGLIIVSFGAVIIWTNPLSMVLAIVLIGGRQLGLGVLVHDCAHHALFESRRTNELVGKWLCGAAVNIDLQEYRDYHLKHHKYAGTAEDPDLIFVDKYPVERASLKRKFIRDLTGRTGVRDLMVKLKAFKLSKHAPWLGFHLSLLSTLILIGHAWAYSLWWAAELFVFPALARLRQIGEHGVATDRGSKSPRLNTGTTIAPWWQKIFIAPNYVNYHLEHHLFASVPPYNLAKLHQHLHQRGYYNDFDCITYGYGQVIKRAFINDRVEMS